MLERDPLLSPDGDHPALPGIFPRHRQAGRAALAPSLRQSRDQAVRPVWRPRAKMQPSLITQKMLTRR